MLYLLLLVLGLLIGAVFLVVLLIGDRKEARLEAQQKMLQEQRVQAGQPVDGAWPPPPSVSARLNLSQPTSSSQTALARAASRKMVRTFFLIRNYALGTTVLSYIIYSCFPRFDFVWVLLATALVSAAIWTAVTVLQRRAKPSSAVSQERG